MQRKAVCKDESSCQAAGRVDLGEFEYVLSPDAKVDEQIDFLEKLNGLIDLRLERFRLNWFGKQRVFLPAIAMIALHVQSQFGGR